MKRPSLPRITCCLSSGPPRLEEHTGGMGDYAIGWKRPSKSPTIPHPKTLWLGRDAHPFPSKSPSIPIQSPSKTRLDGQSAGRDDATALESPPLCSKNDVEQGSWPRSCIAGHGQVGHEDGCHREPSSRPDDCPSKRDLDGLWMGPWMGMDGPLKPIQTGFGRDTARIWMGVCRQWRSPQFRP